MIYSKVYFFKRWIWSRLSPESQKFFLLSVPPPDNVYDSEWWKEFVECLNKHSVKLVAFPYTCIVCGEKHVHYNSVRLICSECSWWVDGRFSRNKLQLNLFAL